MRLLLQRTTFATSLAAMLVAGVGYAQPVGAPAFPQTQTDAPPPPPPQDGPPRGGPGRGGPEHRVEMLQRALNLTPDQTTQVRSLFETERTKMEAQRSNTALSHEDRRSQMGAIHQDTQTRMHALLTPDQATKYDTLEARMRERRDRGGEAGPPPPPPGTDR